MFSRRARGLEVLNISALDLFASTLGVFILLAVLLFPYYLKQPSLAQELEAARQELSVAEAALTEVRRSASQATRERAQAESLLKQAVTDRQRAEQAQSKALQARMTAVSQASQTQQKGASLQQRLANLSITDLDLVFVMDTTGSMRDEIRDVQQNLLSIIRVLHRLAPRLKVGFVAFKDRTDEYLTKVFPLSPMNQPNLQSIQTFVEQLSAKGGDDTPEPVGEALTQALEMPWRSDAQGRIVIIGDAPAHSPDWSGVFDMAAVFHGAHPQHDGVNRRLSAIFTGRGTAGRGFYERLARAGGGDFVYHRGHIMESVLLSILETSQATASGQDSLELLPE